MHQFVQSAIDAANQGDKNKAMNFLREVLAANPSNVDAWLVLAAVVDEPQRKRQCLNRVLALDPVNKLARDELLDMDRADMGGTPPFMPEIVSVSKPTPQPRSQPSMSLESNRPASRPAPTQAKHVTLSTWEDETPKAQPKPASKPGAEKPTVFKYSTVTRILIYVIAVISLCSFLFALQDARLLLFPCGLYLLILPAVWIVSRQVEVSEKGIRVSQLFGLVSSEVGWNEIARIKSNSMQRNLALTTKRGNPVTVTTQVVGYPTIVETLRQKRPDLFGVAPSPSMQSNTFASTVSSPSLGYDIPIAVPSFSGTRTFKKSVLRLYGLLLFILPLGFFSIWAAIVDPNYRLGMGITAAVCFLFFAMSFFQVGSVKVEPNKLVIESFVEQKAFSAKEIREIKMQSARGRYGRITNYVNIVTAQGKNYPMQGFKDGDELIYGILHQWWESYRNR
jgi:hypothetical protein